MKIAVNALSVQGGGGLTFLRNLLYHLLLIDKKNEYLILAVEEKAEELGIRDPHPNLRTLIYPSRGWVTRGMWEQILLPWVMRRESVDILYAPGNQGPVFFRFPFVLLIQSVDPFMLDVSRMPTEFRVKMKVLQILMRISVRKAKKVIAISSYVRRLLINEFNCDPRRIDVVSHGRPHDVGFKDMHSSDDIGRYSTEVPYFLAVSDIRYNKNYEILIEAFANASRRIAQPLNLLIAGEVQDKRYFLRLKEVASRNNVTSVVKFLGSVDHSRLRGLYAEALALVFPSRLESFGLPPLEAMAYGVPVLAANIESVREVCGDAVMYFDPDSSEAVANAIVRIGNDESLRRNLVERGRAQAKQFEWENTARETLAILEGASE